MASPQQPRPRTADPASHYSFLGTRRSFPLVGRKKTKSTLNLDRPSTSHHPSSAPTTGLRIKLLLKFAGPLNSSHHAEFQSSPSFEPSDKACQALLRRLQHCSAELITRQDRTALDPPPVPSQSRPMRFQLTYCIDRHGLRWAEETVSSYQQDPVDTQLEQDIIAECRLSVSSFLSRHDPGFRDNETDSTTVRPETSRPCVGRPQALCCIPQRTRDALTPGFLIELCLRSRSGSGSKNTSFRIESRQSAPLTVILGEDVLSKTTKILDAAFEERKIRFEEVHRPCDGLEGSGGCTHLTDGAVDALVKIRNNIGPDYNHLSHRLQTYRILFAENEPQEFDNFASNLKAKLEDVRDLADRGLNAVDDVTFSIRNFESQGDLIMSPLSVALDGSVTYNRRTTEALMTRIQAGIQHVLRGTGVSLLLTVHKRGHLIFDGTIQGVAGKAQQPTSTTDNVLTALKDQIRADIIMLCKDTCSYECSDLLYNLQIYDARSPTTKDKRPSTAGPMMPDDPPVTPSRQSLSKRKGQQNLRQVSAAGLGASPSEFVQSHGYMAGIISDDAYLSDDSSTPSLVDTDSISPHDSILITPEPNRVATRAPPSFGLRLMDDELMGSPISTRGTGSTHDEAQFVFDAPPFASVFDSTKMAYNLPAHCQSDIDTAPPSKRNDVVIQSGSTESAQTITQEPAVDEIASGSSHPGEGMPGSDAGSDDPVKCLEILCPGLNILTPAVNARDDVTPSNTIVEVAKPEPAITATDSEEASLETELDFFTVPKDAEEILATEPEPMAAPVVVESTSEVATTTTGQSLVSEHSKEAFLTEPESAATHLATDELLMSAETNAPLMLEDCQETDTTKLEQNEVLPDTNTVEQEKQKAPSLDTTEPIAITQPPSRPLLSFTQERPKSSALIIRSNSGMFPISTNFKRERTNSALIGGPERRWSSPRPLFHRRQFSSPTAGYLGLHGEHLVQVGLMNAVIPSHLRYVQS